MRPALHDPAWLADRIADTGRRWDCSDPRVNATLWWYSASAHLLTRPMAQLVAERPLHGPDPQGLELAPNGYLQAVADGPAVPSVAGLAAALVEVCSPTTVELARLGGMSERALWAIWSDSVVNRSLHAARGGRIGAELVPAEVAEPSRHASVCAVRMIELVRGLGLPVPLPRFVEVGRAGVRGVAADQPVAAATVRAGRRSSCCLIYRTPAEMKAVGARGGAGAGSAGTGGSGDGERSRDALAAACASCPKLTPARRAERMTLALLGPRPDPR